MSLFKFLPYNMLWYVINITFSCIKSGLPLYYSCYYAIDYESFTEWCFIFISFYVNLMVSKVMDLCKFWSIIQYHYKNLVNHYYRAKFDFFKTSIQSYLLPWRDRLYRAMRFLNNWVLVYIGISFNLRIHLRIWNKFDLFYFKYSS